jgi:hypothetical protein
MHYRRKLNKIKMLQTTTTKRSVVWHTSWGVDSDVTNTYMLTLGTNDRAAEELSS